jgi:hypothetical protein
MKRFLERKGHYNRYYSLQEKGIHQGHAGGGGGFSTAGNTVIAGKKIHCNIRFIHTLLAGHAAPLFCIK